MNNHYFYYKHHFYNYTKLELYKEIETFMNYFNSFVTGEVQAILLKFAG